MFSVDFFASLNETVNGNLRQIHNAVVIRSNAIFSSGIFILFNFFFCPVDESFVSAVSDASYSEPSEVFEDEIPSTKYVMVNTVETTRTQDTTPNIGEKVSSGFLASVIRGSHF